jgi:hypothetical protein
MELDLVQADAPEREARRLVGGLLAGAFLACLAWVVLVAGQLGRPHPNNLWVEQSYAFKVARAEALAGQPRVLVIAGSSALFGIDSPLLGKLLGRPAVNLGVNAGIGAPYVIAHTRHLVRPGDLVLLPLEYGLYNYDGDLNQVFLDYVLSHPEVMADAPWSFWLNVLWSAPLERVWQGYRGVPDGFAVEGLYGAHNLDIHGDQLNAGLAQRTPALHAGALNSPAERHGARFRPDSKGWVLWAEFTRELSERGACVLFLPPPILERPSYHSDPIERRFYADLAAHARLSGLTFFGNPTDFFYPADWFFDTNYHLASEYRAVHTERVGQLSIEASSQCTQKQPINVIASSSN